MLGTALVDWSRAQFALTAGYHWIFVPLTLGLAVIMATMETIYVIKGDEFWKKTAKFWMKLFAINFAVGIATGIILEFEFGTNWSNYSWFVGDIFGAPLAIEGIFAFFMEATFFAVMFFGWNKVSKRVHLAATWLTGIGAAISAVWILVANSWMQHPVGMEFNPDTVRHEMVDFWALVLNPVAVSKFFHSVFSGWMTGSIFVIGISCWYLIKKRETRFALSSIRVAAIVGIVGTFAVMFSGDSSAIHVAEYQPMKLAAAEGLEDGGKGAPFSIVPGVEVPGMLSILATHDIDGYVPGINNILEGYTNSSGEIVPSAEEKISRGKNTTRTTELFSFGNGTYLADTPGFSSVNTELYCAIEHTELHKFFPEFASHVGNCRYNDCTHTKETECGIADAVEKGIISSQRHESYKKLYNELKNINRYK